MKSKFVILGAGMQGTAAAYDLAQFADASTITLADYRLEVAEASATRVNQLIGRDAVTAVQANATDRESLRQIMADTDVLLSCVPYYMHPLVAEMAVETSTSMLDLGGNTEITQKTLSLNDPAKERGITLVPDCGLAPGLVNSLGMWLIEQLDETESVRLYCGVLPQNPIPPLNYKVTFNVEGLVAEYDYEAVVLRNGEIATVPTLTEHEHLEIDGFGSMEAFVTSGGTSMAPWSLLGKVTNYDYKTIRFPGHCDAMKLYKDFGLWREDEVEVKGVKVRPKDVWCKVFGEKLSQIEDLDQCLIRAVGIGTKDGQPKTLQIDIHDRQDTETGFTSMERLTGFSLSIYAIEVASGRMERGALRYELAMSGTRFVEEIQKRGIQLRFS